MGVELRALEVNVVRGPFHFSKTELENLKQRNRGLCKHATGAAGLMPARENSFRVARVNACLKRESLEGSRGAQRGVGSLKLIASNPVLFR